MRKFDNRNELKKELHNRPVDESVFIKEREVWFTHLGVNIGSEENGKGDRAIRPVLVMKKLWSLFLVIPMTTKGKDGSLYFHRLDDKYFGYPSYLMISQIKVIDKRRFYKKFGVISKDDFFSIKEKLRNYYF